MTEPYHLDARKCISYLTIERRTEMDSAEQECVGEWLFGCDICQDVCPFNRRAPDSAEPAFTPRFASGSVALQEVLGWLPNEHNPRLSGSAMKRVKLPILQRNAQAMLDRQNVLGQQCFVAGTIIRLFGEEKFTTETQSTRRLTGARRASVLSVPLW